METQKELELLANKLGTTVEYLWDVLIKQARIYAITTIFEIVLTLILGYLLYRLHKYFLGKKLYRKYEEVLGFPMIIAFSIYLILMIGVIFTISDVIAAIFNPEYWALKQILNAI